MSSYGEDIIRETFEKFGDAIGVQMQMPAAMITNLGAVLQAQIDLLAELQSTGRLLADDDQRLTAEQVEDVRALVWLDGRRNFDAFRRLRALFPATEPAEATINSTLNVPAPAEPAEEETKAEEVCTGSGGHHLYPCVLPDGHAGVHVDREGLRWNNVASSPVVPAPTETGPWQRIEDVPEGVGRLTDRDGDVWEWDGDDWVTPETAILPTAYINKHYAPFVAAEEG